MMDVISPTFGVQDLLPVIIVVSVVMVIASIMGIVNATSERMVGSFFETAGIGLIFATSLGLLTLLFHAPLHHDNMVADLEQRFEDGYDLTIVDNTRWAEIPLTPGDDTEAVKVFLHEVAGEQTILVEIVDGKYVVTHNGEVREVQND